MTIPFAFECFADGVVVAFLKEELGVQLAEIHSFSQGEVVNDVLVRRKALIGLVDEDPRSTHHGQRDRMAVKSQTKDVEHRTSSGRHIILLRPDLEQAFFRGLKLAKLETKIAKDAPDLHQMLGRPHGKKHEDFRRELKRLYDESKSGRVASFLTELETILRTIAG